jgi:hypothetical protein
MLRTVSLHDGQELDNDLGAGSDQDLALASLLGIVDRLESVVKNRSLDHFGGGGERFSDRWNRGNEVSAKRSISLQKP